MEGEGVGGLSSNLKKKIQPYVLFSNPGFPLQQTVARGSHAYLIRVVFSPGKGFSNQVRIHTQLGILIRNGKPKSLLMLFTKVRVEVVKLGHRTPADIYVSPVVKKSEVLLRHRAGQSDEGTENTQ